MSDAKEVPFKKLAGIFVLIPSIIIPSSLPIFLDGVYTCHLPRACQICRRPIVYSYRRIIVLSAKSNIDKNFSPASMILLPMHQVPAAVPAAYKPG